VAEPEWSIAALDDIEQIAEYISSRNPGYGAVFVRKLVAAVEALSDFPRRGRQVPELSSEDFRELVFQNYRIVYRLIGQRIVVLGVWHGAVDLESRMEGRPWDLT
jgi:plasmid stabilization system protein ParE